MTGPTSPAPRRMLPSLSAFDALLTGTSTFAQYP